MEGAADQASAAANSPHEAKRHAGSTASARSIARDMPRSIVGHFSEAGENCPWTIRATLSPQRKEAVA